MDDILRPKKRPTFDGIVPGNSSPLKETPAPTPLTPETDIPEPSFKTPEEVADEDIVNAATSQDTDPAEDTPSNEPTKKARRFKPHMPHGKKQWIISVLLALIFLIGSGAAAYWFLLRETPSIAQAPAPAPVTKAVVVPKPTTEVSKLSGRVVPIGSNLKPVTAIQIENSPDARPQSGLKDASIIFEAIAEGGITRFNAIFQDTSPDYVGPVRSLRPYYIDWFWPFDASIAHVGGAPQALADIKSLGIKDLDQFYNGGAYDRITSRFAPHNVYTSIARLNDLEKSKGFTSADYTGFLRKKEAKLATPTAKKINLGISSYYYNAEYAYSPTTNAYLRSEGGEPHKDDKSGTQLEPKVVVAIVMGRGIASDGQHTDYTTIGSGHMFVFQDGGVQEGTWTKESRKAQWKFADASGKDIAFNPGQTWFSMVDNNGAVTYAP